jgi:hypothetical protein
MMTYTDKLEAFFRDRPMQWTDGLIIGEIAGVYGWRSRISDTRKRGLNIQNKQLKRPDGSIRSLYRYVPESKPKPIGS